MAQQSNKTLAYAALRYSMIVIVVLAVLHLVFQYINIYYNDEAFGNFYEVTNRLDFDDEASIPTWYSQLLFLMGAIVAGLIAYIERKRKSSYRVWLMVAAICVLGSVDEVSTIHETGLQGLHLLFFDENTPTLLANAWIVVLPIVVALALLFINFARKVLPKRTVLLFIASGSVYLLGAIGVDILTSVLVDFNAFIEQGILVAIEEVMELVGLTLLLFTSLDYLESHYHKNISGIRKLLRQ